VLATISVLFFAGYLAFFFWARLEAAAVSRYEHAVECAVDAPITDHCVTRGTATVAAELQLWAGSAHRSPQWSVTLTGHGRIPDQTFTVFAAYPLLQGSKVGDTVTVSLWDGRLDTVANRLGTAHIGDSPADDLRALDFIGALLLGLSVFAGWAGRVPLERLGRRPRRPRLDKVLKRSWLPGIALGTFLVAMGFLDAGQALTWFAGVPAFVLYFGSHLLPGPARPSAPVHRPTVVEQRGHERERDGERAREDDGDRPRSDGCPVTEREQAWIETSMDWFTTQFGYDPVRRATILPNRQFFPGTYAGTDADIGALFRTVCRLMGIDARPLVLKIVGDPGEAALVANLGLAHQSRSAAGTYHRDAFDRIIVEIDRAEAPQPERLAAVIAHELGHVRLNGEGRVPTDRPDNEPLTDLFTVYFGMGVFNANAAFVFAKGPSGSGWSVSRLGYLDDRMFGYALACYARLHQDKKVQWAEYLTTNPRTYMRHGMEYLDRAAPQGGFPTARGSVRAARRNPRMPSRALDLEAADAHQHADDREAEADEHAPQHGGVRIRAEEDLAHGVHDVPERVDAGQVVEPRGRGLLGERQQDAGE
jgi:hypothetical protein